MLKREGRGRQREEYDHDIREAVAGYGVKVPPIENGAVDGGDFRAIKPRGIGGELDEAGAGGDGGRDGGGKVLGGTVDGVQIAGVVGECEGSCYEDDECDEEVQMEERHACFPCPLGWGCAEG